MGSANQLTQIVCHLVGIPEIFHAKADDINEILHKPEQLPGVWPYLQRDKILDSTNTNERSMSFFEGKAFYPHTYTGSICWI